MAIRRCGWCGKVLGLALDVVGEETTGICEVCEVKFDAENALAHAIIVLRTLTAEMERARASVWGPREQG